MNYGVVFSQELQKQAGVGREVKDAFVRHHLGAIFGMSPWYANPYLTHGVGGAALGGLVGGLVGGLAGGLAGGNWANAGIGAGIGTGLGLGGAYGIQSYAKYRLLGDRRGPGSWGRILNPIA